MYICKSNDELYENIATNEELLEKLEVILKQDTITSSKISSAVNESIGVSNEQIEEYANIKIEEGILILIFSKD